MSVFSDQREFMKACGQSLGHTATERIEGMLLWSKLIDEEYEELKYELAGGTRAGLAKEAIDLIYVVCGLLNSLNIDGQLVWDEVQRSNMAKVGPDGKVTKREDGKILKPAGWQKPDIESLLR